MDDLLKEVIIQNARILLDMEWDTNKDTLFEIYFQNAEDFIFDYCNISEIPASLNSVLTQMIVFQYRQMGVENIQSEGKGSLSQAFLVEYPQNIMNRLNRHARVKFQ
ncbi:phage head-tail connector protein [Neobacillus drentensis]|uniref:phage head-tail connector protein n=1 Tax=Neobacillus drentensis TaxID=220684 RepID=UPI00300030FB